MRYTGHAFATPGQCNEEEGDGPRTASNNVFTLSQVLKYDIRGELGEKRAELRADVVWRNKDGPGAADSVPGCFCCDTDGVVSSWADHTRRVIIDSVIRTRYEIPRALKCTDLALHRNARRNTTVEGLIYVRAGARHWNEDGRLGVRIVILEVNKRIPPSKPRTVWWGACGCWRESCGQRAL